MKQILDLNNPAVTRCVCFGKLIATLKKRSPPYTSLKQIEEETRVGSKCGLCQPYIKHRLKLKK